VHLAPVFNVFTPGVLPTSMKDGGWVDWEAAVAALEVGRLPWSSTHILASLHSANR
jgi:hypothetical protein